MDLCLGFQERVNKSVATQRRAQHHHCSAGSEGAPAHRGRPGNGGSSAARPSGSSPATFQTRVLPRFKPMLASSANAVRRARKEGTARSAGHVMCHPEMHTSPHRWNGPSAMRGGCRPRTVQTSTGRPVRHPPPEIRCGPGRIRHRKGIRGPRHRTCGQEG